MQIPPHYQLNTTSIDLLTKIEANRLFLNSVAITPAAKNRIQRVSLLKSSLFSARIEGNPLTLTEFESTHDVVQKQEVDNILRTITYIDTHLRPNQLITAQTLLSFHRVAMHNLSDQAGRWRSEVSAIFNQSGVAVYMPPPPQQIQSLVTELLNFVNSNKESNVLIRALITHLLFEKIHPFLDGNGRAGRLLIYAICKQSAWEFPVIVPIEEYIDETKEGYYYHLDTGLADTEGYLLYMLEEFWAATEKLKSDIFATTQQAILPVTPRQEEIYHIIKDHGTVSFDSIHRRFLKVPQRTLRYDLKKLIDQKLVIKIGHTRGAFYQIKK